MKPESPRPVLLAEYTPPPYLISKVDLSISLDPTRTQVKARFKVERNPKSTAPRALRLDGEYLELDQLAIEGVELLSHEYALDETGLTIHAPPLVPFTLTLTTFVNPQANTALQGIYLSRGIYCSQCEAQGFRRITFFIDRPDVLSVYTVRLEAELKTAPILLANGNPVERGTLVGGQRHYAVWHDPFPKPSYLFAIVGGDLAPVGSNFKTMSGRDIDVRIYVEHGKENRAHWAMDSLKRAMAWDERRFGREYDLDIFNIVAVSDFNMGAMENKGLNIFNDRLILASAETATDANYEAIESVVAHEYFHNWTGNRITCRDWFQLCLKEGLTVYRDQEFSSDERSRTVQRVSDVRQLQALQFPEDQGPMSHPVRPESYIEINNFYTPTVYEKGAELVRMIETILGPQTFRAGMDLYFDRHDGDAATIEDFLTCFEDASGQSLAHFKLWYSQSGTPELVCDFRHDPITRTAELVVHQNVRPSHAQPKKEPLFLPMKMALLGGNGQELDLELESGTALRPGVLAITERSQTFKFKNIATRPVPSLLRGFSAPVNVTIDLSDSDLAFLMRHDSDLFNRWKAANRFASRTILNALAGGTAAATEAGALRYASALAAALEDSSLDDAYKAELLKLPTPSDIARDKGANVDPAAIDAAHRAMSRQVATALSALLEKIYAGATTTEPYTPDAASAGRRALRNAALTLLTSRCGLEDYARLDRHFTFATNMTDTAHALSLLAGIDIPARTRALASFFERWQGDHLVIDMWFAVQAQSPLPTTLNTVRELAAHPLFKLSTPNKVRALLGTFALSNPLQFNRADGAGYAFLAEKVLEVDKLNPQVSARLLGAFRSYRALEPNRMRLAADALSRVASTPGISRDLGEIVGRMLED
ncbi:MAG: aminopeptidase N [Hyphomicrobium sp.]|nr:aminopeptidase N [Hyphomicrobium sp.]